MKITKQNCSISKEEIFLVVSILNPRTGLRGLFWPQKDVIVNIFQVGFTWVPIFYVTLSKIVLWGQKRPQIMNVRVFFWPSMRVKFPENNDFSDQYSSNIGIQVPSLTVSLGVSDLMCRPTPYVDKISHLYYLQFPKFRKFEYFWAHPCSCMVGSYASPSVRLSVRPGQILEKKSLEKKSYLRNKRSRSKVRVKGRGHYKCKSKGRWAHANV